MAMNGEKAYGTVGVQFDGRTTTDQQMEGRTFSVGAGCRPTARTIIGDSKMMIAANCERERERERWERGGGRRRKERQTEKQSVTGKAIAVAN